MLISMASGESVEAENAVRSAGVLNKVRDLADRLQGIQSFMDGYMEAEDLFEAGDLDDMLKNIEEFKGQLRGHRHHAIPQEFRTMLADVKHLNIDKLTVFLSQKVHLQDLHGNGYNQIFRDFLNKNMDKIKKNPLFLIGFATGILKKVGLGDAYLNPAIYA